MPWDVPKCSTKRKGVQIALYAAMCLASPNTRAAPDLISNVLYSQRSALLLRLCLTFPLV